MATNSYECKALIISEKYGILNYSVKGKNMVFYDSWVTTSKHDKNTTYKNVYALDTDTWTRAPLKNYYKPNSKLGTHIINYAI